MLLCRFHLNLGYENFLFPIFAFICMGGSLLVVAVYQVGHYCCFTNPHVCY